MMLDNNTLSPADKIILVQDLIFAIEQDPSILNTLIDDYVHKCDNNECKELEVLIGTILGDFEHE